MRISDAQKRWHGPPAFPSSQHSFLGQQQPAPHTITPTDSDSDEANTLMHQQNSQQQHEQHQQQSTQGVFSTLPNVHTPTSFHLEPELQVGVDEDMDMCMDTPDPLASSMEQHEQHHDLIQGWHLRPGSLQPDPIGQRTLAGRMPTPIQPSFAEQVRGGKNWGGAVGNIMGTPPPHHLQNGMAAMHDDVGKAEQQGTSATYQGPGTAMMTDWNQVQNRRLPSPISENGGERQESPSPRNVPMTPRERQNYCHQRGYAKRTWIANSVVEPRSSSAPGNMLSGLGTVTSLMKGLRANQSADPDNSMDVEPSAPSPPRKGHSRSRHTVNSWTLQPGMKKSFSIGYRADCEKCRLKVPGHFNHIIIS